jgi:hypothetical protein
MTIYPKKDDSCKKKPQKPFVFAFLRKVAKMSCFKEKIAPSIHVEMMCFLSMCEAYQALPDNCVRRGGTLSAILVTKVRLEKPGVYAPGQSHRQSLFTQI